MAKNLNKEKELAAKEAVKLIADNQIVGLGTGSTAFYVIQEIGKLVKDGLKIQGIPTSNKTGEIARSLNIPLVDINTVEHIDITVDGADEFNEDLVLIKGGGGALMREKIVASITRHEIIIADSSKKVEQLGKFPLPIEVIPFAASYVTKKLLHLNGTGKIRRKENEPFITDQGNYILDTDFGLIADPVALAASLNTIEGIVCHGLFIGLASRVIMGIDETNTTVTYTK